MKKAIFLVGIILLLSGCGTTESLTCTNINTVNGLTSNRTYKIDYKDDDVKMVTITYDYMGNSTTTNNTDNNQNNAGTGANDTTTNNIDDDNQDGVGTGTDGTTSDNNDNDGGIIDGVVGEALDDVVTGVTNTILDIAGIRTTHNNRISTYSNVTGFYTSIDTDSDNNYKITYKYNLEEMDDSDLSKFNLDRSFTTLRTNYTNQGLTCK